jgi:enamine deaminase RidA (YjgF/YER057c/UK114 family)
MTITRFEPNPTMHRAVAYNGVLHVSGIFASDLTAGMEGQTADTLKRIEQVLLAHGSSKDKVLTGTVYVTDLSLKEEMNTAWKAFFDPAHLPTRATVGISDLGPNILVEIVLTAALA